MVVYHSLLAVPDVITSVLGDPIRGRIDTAAARNPPLNILEANAVSKQIVYVTDDTFETEVLNSDQPVLVDYWAEWCGPCKVIAPILDEVSEEYGDKLKIAKLNID